MVQWFYFDSKLHYSHYACPARCRTRCLAMSVLLLPRFFKLLGVWEQHLKVGRKPFPIAHVFFKDLKHMLHILSYIIIYILYVVILEIRDTSEKMTSLPLNGQGHPMSHRRQKKHQLLATPHLSLFCDGVLHAPVATHPPRDVH